MAELRLGGRKLAHATFTTGWHAREPGLRWTDGMGVLTPPRLARAAKLTVVLADAGGQYWVEPVATPALRVGVVRGHTRECGLAESGRRS